VKILRDHPEAEWLPSRQRFALTRLLALALLSVAPALSRRASSTADHIALAIDRDQNAIEAYAVSLWWMATSGSYIAVLLPLVLPLALIAGAFLTTAVVPLFCATVSLPLGSGDHRKVNSAALMALLAAASAYFVMQPGWIRLVAWLFFALLAGNAAAAMILWLLRNRVQAVEARCGA
jgi:hypothetical protein